MNQDDSSEDEREVSVLKFHVEGQDKFTLYHPIGGKFVVCFCCAFLAPEKESVKNHVRKQHKGLEIDWDQLATFVEQVKKFADKSELLQVPFDFFRVFEKLPEGVQLAKVHYCVKCGRTSAVSSKQKFCSCEPVYMAECEGIVSTRAGGRNITPLPTSFPTNALQNSFLRHKLSPRPTWASFNALKRERDQALAELLLLKSNPPTSSNLPLSSVKVEVAADRLSSILEKAKNMKPPAPIDSTVQDVAKFFKLHNASQDELRALLDLACKPKDRLERILLKCLEDLFQCFNYELDGLYRDQGVELWGVWTSSQSDKTGVVKEVSEATRKKYCQHVGKLVLIVYRSSKLNDSFKHRLEEAMESDNSLEGSEDEIKKKFTAIILEMIYNNFVKPQSRGVSDQAREFLLPLFLTNVPVSAQDGGNNGGDSSDNSDDEDDENEEEEEDLDPNVAVLVVLMTMSRISQVAAALRFLWNGTLVLVHSCSDQVAPNLLDHFDKHCNSEAPKFTNAVLSKARILSAKQQEEELSVVTSTNPEGETTFHFKSGSLSIAQICQGQEDLKLMMIRDCVALFKDCVGEDVEFAQPEERLNELFFGELAEKDWEIQENQNRILLVGEGWDVLQKAVDCAIASDLDKFNLFRLKFRALSSLSILVASTALLRTTTLFNLHPEPMAHRDGTLLVNATNF